MGLGKKLKKAFGGSKKPAKGGAPASQEGLGGLGGNAHGLGIMQATEELCWQADNPMLSMLMSSHAGPTNQEPAPVERARDSGAQASSRLRDAGGKGPRGSGFRDIQKRLAALDVSAGSDAERQREAELLKADVKAWLEKHAGTDDKRVGAMQQAIEAIDYIRSNNMAGNDDALAAAIDGATPDMDTLTRAHARVDALKQKESANNGRVRDLSAGGDQDGADRLRAVNRQNGFMNADVTMAIDGMSDRFLQQQVGERGRRGGKSLGAIGSGNVGTAHRAQFGSESLIFKAQEELPEVMHPAGTSAGLGAHRAVASSLVNDLLGTNVIGRTELAEMDGEFGTSMPAAQGDAVRQAVSLDSLGLTDADLPEYASQPNAKELFVEQGADFSDPKLQEGLIDLQINDILSAQVDRHASNYHVAKDETGAVTGVSGFDLDASFGKDMGNWQERVHDIKAVGMGKGSELFANAVDFPPLMSERQAAAIEAMSMVDLHDTLSAWLPAEEVSAAVERLLDLQAHVHDLRQQGNVVEGFDDKTFDKLLQGGAKSSYVARDHLSTQNMKASLATAQANRDVRTA